MAKLPRVSVSLMTEEYRRLDWLARSEGKRKSQLVRRFVREGLEREVPVGVGVDELDRLRREVLESALPPPEAIRRGN